MTKDELKVIKDRTQSAERLLKKVEKTTEFIDKLRIGGTFKVEDFEYVGDCTITKGSNTTTLSVSKIEKGILHNQLINFFETCKAEAEKELQAL